MNPLDAIMERLSQDVPATVVAEALSEFQKRCGRVDHQSAAFGNRTEAFFVWLATEYQPFDAGIQQPRGAALLAQYEACKDPELRANLRHVWRSQRSLFEVGMGPGQNLTLTCLWGGGRFHLSERAARSISVNMVIDGRVAIADQATSLLYGLTIHPLEPKEARRLAHEAQLKEICKTDFLDGLLRAECRALRFPHMPKKHLYSLSAILEHEVASAPWSRTHHTSES